MMLYHNYRKVLRINGGLFLLMLLFINCSSAQKENKQEEATQVSTEATIEKGKVTEVTVRSNASESYALYVPSSYSKEKKYAVVFFFDPHAAGDLPLNKYKALAEKYNIIMAGSNNSKNGLAFESVLPAAQRMIQQVKQDLSIDERMVFTGGFSGGSRVASSVAMMDQSVKGVIGCSAGFQVQEDALPFIFAGVTANEDMNYLEMQELELQLDKHKGEHVLIEGNGKHEWPDTIAMKDALRFMLFRTLKKDVSREWIDELKKDHELLCNQPSAGSRYSCDKLLYRYLDGIDEAGEDAKTEMATLEKKPEIIKDKQQLLDDIALEKKLQQSYSQALLSQPLDWWATASRKLSEGKAETKSIDMSHRILNYLSLQCYMIVNQAMKQGDAKATSHFLTVYSMVDPKNPEWAYLSAVVFAMSGDNEQALKSLQVASNLGFNDPNRINSETAFTKIISDPRFKAAYDKISSNKK